MLKDAQNLLFESTKKNTTPTKKVNTVKGNHHLSSILYHIPSTIYYHIRNIQYGFTLLYSYCLFILTSYLQQSPLVYYSQ